MFNVYTKEARERRANSICVESQKQDTLRRRHLKRRDDLAVGYRQRVEKFLLNMVKQPVEVEYEPPHPWSHNYSYREKANKPFVGPDSLRYSDSSDKQRLETYDREKMLDTTASTELKKWLRPREVTKEINPKFRFQAISTLERVEDQIQRQPTYIPGMISKSFSVVEQRETQTQKSPREIHNPLHFKTHFKAVETFTLPGQNKSLQSPTKEQAKEFIDEEKKKAGNTQGGKVQKHVMIPNGDLKSMSDRIKGITENQKVILTHDQTEKLAATVMTSSRLKPFHRR